MEDLLNFDDIVGGATTLSDAAAYSVPAYILEQLDQQQDVILTSQFAYNDEWSHDQGLTPYAAQRRMIIETETKETEK